MRAGTLNVRVTIQQLAGTVDGLGQPVPTWNDFATVWANVAHTSGIETIRADAIASVVRASIRVRYRTDITTGMRATAGGHTYNIVAVMPDIGGKEYTDLACEVIR